MADVRWFDPDVEALAPHWRGVIVSIDAWKPVGNPGAAGGEAQGYFVQSGSLDGYAKESGAVFRAAHEKIASDLAFDLKLPIPPVVLWATPGGRTCAVSLVPFPAPQKWEHAALATDAVAQMLPQLSKAASAMTVFDTWVDNRDRVNGGNVLVTMALGGGFGVAYIDYAYSLTYGWGDGPAPSVAGSVPPFPSVMTVARYNRRHSGIS